MAKGVVRFNRDLEKFAKKIDVEVGIAVRKIALDLYSRITRKTPVKTGRARASWNINAGKVDPSVFPEGQAADKAAGARKHRQFKMPHPFAKVFITNNLPYIKALEKGHSKKQAPLGMVKLSLIELKTFLDGVLKK